MWSISCSGGSRQPQPAQRYCWLNATVFRVFAGKGNRCGFATTDAAAASKFGVSGSALVDFFARRAVTRGREALATSARPVRASASIIARSFSIDQGGIRSCRASPQAAYRASTAASFLPKLKKARARVV